MKRTILAALTVCPLIAAACAGDSGEQEQAPSGPPTLSGSSLSAVQGFIPEEENVSDGSGCSSSAGAERSCVSYTLASESLPLDLYIMFDQSGSMCSCTDPEAAQICPNPECEETRLDAIRRATEQFLLDPASAGIGVGLGRFGHQPIGAASCEAAPHAAPSVTLGLLPEHAPAIMQALDQLQPTGETPTGAALRGACSYAQGSRAAAPERRVVLLLVTDGKPEAPASCQAGTCCPSLPDAVAAATDCRLAAGIDTYVLGVGPLLGNLDEIAVAGGTERAYLVDGSDVSRRVLEALNRIRGEAQIPCELQLPPAPPGQTLAYDRVNLQYHSSACEETMLYAVPSGAECGDLDGWYYDNPDAPGSMRLCPRTCDRVSVPGGTLSYSVGCETQFLIR